MREPAFYPKSMHNMPVDIFRKSAKMAASLETGTEGRPGKEAFLKPVLGMIDRDRLYAGRLADAVGAREDFPYEVVLMERWEELRHLRADVSVRLILSDGPPQDPRDFSGIPVLFLTEEKREAANEVYRYQPIPVLIREILKKAESVTAGSSPKDLEREVYDSKNQGIKPETGRTALEGEWDTAKKEERPEDLRQRLYRKLLQEMSLSEEISDEELYRRIDRVLLQETEENSLTEEARVQQRELLFSAVRGFDVLSIALRDPAVTEVMINGRDRIFIEKEGRIEEFPEHFLSDTKLSDVVQRIASSVNRRVNEATPMADAMLPGGLRVNLVLPPVAPDGPVVTVRRFPENPITMEDLVGLRSISREAAEFLRVLVRCGYNLFISGGTGAGKTTFLGALASLIPETERVILIEDSPELQIRNLKNLVRLETRPANLEGEYEVSIRQLIRNALRMRPDRIIVGEIRGEEALDMLQAMNTGHDGSLSTGHGNSCADMLSRIETMVLMGAEKLPLRAIRAQIASAIDIMVHLERLRDRSRRVMGIYEMRGLSGEELGLSPLFLFRENGDRDGKVDGRLVRTEEQLTRRQKLEKHGARLPGIPFEGGGNPANPGSSGAVGGDPFMAFL